MGPNRPQDNRSFLILLNQNGSEYRLNDPSSVILDSRTVYGGNQTSYELIVKNPATGANPYELQRQTFDSRGVFQKAETIDFSNDVFGYEINFRTDLNGDNKIGGVITEHTFDTAVDPDSIFNPNSFNVELYSINLKGANTKGFLVSSQRPGLNGGVGFNVSSGDLGSISGWSLNPTQRPFVLLKGENNQPFSLPTDANYSVTDVRRYWPMAAPMQNNSGERIDILALNDTLSLIHI